MDLREDVDGKEDMDHKEHTALSKDMDHRNMWIRRKTRITGSTWDGARGWCRSQ